MHLVQILLPLQGPHHAVAAELTDKFGGLTAYTRAPAEGLWQEDRSSRATRDDIVVYEVMVDELDGDWWADYRKDLEGRFAQRELVVRSQEIRRL